MDWTGLASTTSYMISLCYILCCSYFSIVYHALSLEHLTLFELTEKIAGLYSVPVQQICHVYRQGPMGIYVLVSDEVRWPRVHFPMDLNCHNVLP